LYYSISQFKPINMKNVFFKIFVVAFFSLSLISCTHNQINASENTQKNIIIQDTLEVETPKIINESGNVVKDRFIVPVGFTRVVTETNSWGSHLQNLPLKPHGSLVKLFNGDYKGNTSAFIGVVDLPIGKQDLHQCADAVMRLRADYLFSQGRYNEIEFLFVNGGKSNYKSYLAGRTPNKTNYWSYLENVFTYANTYSLNKQLKSKEVKNLEIGDVYIKGGFPGHTVIVVDKCVNKTTGAVKYMLAQSYMPAQEIQILVNPMNPESPWYDLTSDPVIYTAEWDFTSDQFKTF